MKTSGLARPAAALVAAVAWIGLGAQINATFVATGDIGATLWILLRFFTIIANLSIAVVFSLIAADTARKAAWQLVPALTLAILLVGVVYAVLLEGLEHLTGTAVFANFVMHKVTPVLVPLWWLFFMPKGKLTRGAPLRWTIFPLAYLPYGIWRGMTDGRYPYPFLNVEKIGWLQVAGTCLVIAAGFIAAGYALVVLDRILGRRF
ncbi:Pr6Pr family membrane protein [Sphingobium sp. H39-3-25]|uniref:Pr6Pr family membrane protein n=1 Tax=Sphingobium arseniciresistens TaxID=3030834 RepID=UPI0023B90BA7|nr:Pr6Pr family membrane protein [Sphingobium arseniciresistens]